MKGVARARAGASVVLEASPSCEQELQLSVHRLAEKWHPVAVENTGALHDFAFGFVQLAAARCNLGNHEASLHIGTAAGRPAARFQLNGRGASAAEIASASPSPVALEGWRRQVTYSLNVSCKACYRRLRMDGRIGRIDAFHASRVERPEALRDNLQNAWVSAVDVVRMFGGEVFGAAAAVRKRAARKES